MQSSGDSNSSTINKIEPHAHSHSKPGIPLHSVFVLAFLKRTRAPYHRGKQIGYKSPRDKAESAPIHVHHWGLLLQHITHSHTHTHGHHCPSVNRVAIVSPDPGVPLGGTGVVNRYLQRPKYTLNPIGREHLTLAGCLLQPA